MLYLMPVIPFSLMGLVALAKTSAFRMAALSIVGGWGLARYLGTTATDGKSSYSADDPEYIGAFFAALLMSGNILQDHDRIIDHNTDNERQPQHGESIDGKPAKKQNQKSAHDRKGHGQQNVNVGAPGT